MNPDQWLLRHWTGPTSAAACSPLATWLDLGVDEVDRDAGRVRLHLIVPATMRRPSGDCSAGVVAAALDFALSFAALATLEPPTSIVTATLRIESVAATSSETLVAKGEVTARNDMSIFARASLEDDHRVVALASATMRVVSRRP